MATEAKEASSSKIVIASIEEIDECKRTREEQMHVPQQQQQASSLFSGASIQGATINISINTVNQSLIAETEESSKRYKTIRVLADSE